MDILCQKCGKTLRVPDNVDGRTIRCPNCGFLFTLRGNMVSPVAPVSPVASSSASPLSPPSIPLSEFQQTKSFETSPSKKPVRQVPTAASFVQERPLYPTRVNLGSVISDSWRLFSDKLGPIIVAFLLFFVVNIIALIPLMFLGILEVIVEANLDMRKALIFIKLCSGVYNIAYSLLSLWLTTGLFRYMVTIARGETARYSLLFSGGNALWRYFLLSVCWTLILFPVAFIFIVAFVVIGLVFLNSVASNVPAETLSLLVLGGYMLFLIVTIPVFLRLFLSYVLVMDTGIRVWESIRVSWIAMRGNCLSLLGALIFGFFVLVFGLFCFGVGAFLAFPYIQLLMAVFYLHATGQSKSIPEPEGKEYL